MRACPVLLRGLEGAGAVLGLELLEQDPAFSTRSSFHGITGSLRVEKTSKVILFNLCPNPSIPTKPYQEVPHPHIF